MPCLSQQEKPTGTRKVKYTPSAEWDFAVETRHQPIELSLVLPHYRARNQPINHRMAMCLGSESAPIKAKVCRQMLRTNFYLEVQGGTSDVTLWLPSDFKGHIHHSGKAAFSPGFINRIMQNVQFNTEVYDSAPCDEVVVVTQGHVEFRMWDVSTGSPESLGKETWKRVFGCGRRSPEMTIDWDYLLDD
ncbi:hypothetical protein HWV62_44981 [Athelia sp. TMB]|nr:hypothetical protein HWV62_23304 [Athelia sp. TMB]KAF7978707.1 hypothetical protein HWV62_44981 [Athelia sp. TMB]